MNEHGKAGAGGSLEGTAKGRLATLTSRGAGLNAGAAAEAVRVADGLGPDPEAQRYVGAIRAASDRFYADIAAERKIEAAKTSFEQQSAYNDTVRSDRAAALAAFRARRDADVAALRERAIQSRADLARFEQGQDAQDRLADRLDGPQEASRSGAAMAPEERDRIRRAASAVADLGLDALHAGVSRARGHVLESFEGQPVRLVPAQASQPVDAERIRRVAAYIGQTLFRDDDIDVGTEQPGYAAPRL